MPFVKDRLVIMDGCNVNGKQSSLKLLKKAPITKLFGTKDGILVRMKGYNLFITYLFNFFSAIIVTSLFLSCYLMLYPIQISQCFHYYFGLNE